MENKINIIQAFCIPDYVSCLNMSNATSVSVSDDDLMKNIENIDKPIDVHIYYCQNAQSEINELLNPQDHLEFKNNIIEIKLIHDQYNGYPLKLEEEKSERDSIRKFICIINSENNQVPFASIEDEIARMMGHQINFVQKMKKNDNNLIKNNVEKVNHNLQRLQTQSSNLNLSQDFAPDTSRSTALLQNSECFENTTSCSLTIISDLKISNINPNSNSNSKISKIKNIIISLRRYSCELNCFKSKTNSKRKKITPCNKSSNRRKPMNKQQMISSGQSASNHFTKNSKYYDNSNEQNKGSFELPKKTQSIQLIEELNTNDNFSDSSIFSLSNLLQQTHLFLFNKDFVDGFCKNNITNGRILNMGKSRFNSAAQILLLKNQSPSIMLQEQINEKEIMMTDCVICIRLLLLQNEFNIGNHQKIVDLISLLINQFKFKLFIDSGDIKKRQNAIISQFDNTLQIKGQVIYDNSFIKREDPKTKRVIFEMDIDKRIWCEKLGIQEHNFYYIFGQPHHILMYHNEEQKKYSSLLECIQQIYLNFFNHKLILHQKKHSKNNSQICSKPSADFRCIGSNSSITGSSASIQLFEEVGSKKKYVGKVSLETLYDENQESCGFNEYKEILGLMLFSMLGVTVPTNCLSLQLPDQDSNKDYAKINHILKTHAMTEYIEEFHEVGESFLSNYKLKNKNYFYYVDAMGKKGPLIGFGSVLLASYLLNDFDMIGNSGKNLGIIDCNGYYKVVKIDAGEILQDKNIKDTNLQNNEEGYSFILSSNGSRINYDELCENDKQEFILTAELLKNSKEREEKIWNQFIYIKKGFFELKKVYDARKKKVMETLVAIKNNIIKNIIPIEYNSQLKKDVDLAKNNTRIICFNLCFVQTIFTTEKAFSSKYMLNILNTLFNFQLFVWSENSESKQNEIIEEFEYEFPLAGQMVIIADENFQTIKSFNQNKNRKIFQMCHEFEKWATELKACRENFYYTLSDCQTGRMGHNNDQSDNKNLFDVLILLFEKNYLAKCEDDLKRYNKISNPLIKTVNEANDLRPIENIINNSRNAQIFHETANVDKTSIYKESLTTSNENLNDLFNKKKELFALQIYKAFGINILTFQLIDQKNIESNVESQKTHLKNRRKNGFVSFEQNFWADYKKNNLNYFYYPSITERKPLIGFGAALVVMHILNDFDCLNNNFKTIGYYEQDKNLIFTKLHSSLITLTDKSQQVRIKDSQNRNKSLILSNGEHSIYYEDLCEYDQFEFAWMGSNLNNFQNAETDVWKEFMETKHSDMFGPLKNQWMVRKIKFLKEFNDIIKFRLDVSNYNPSKFRIKKNEGIFYATEEIFTVNESEHIGSGTFGVVYKGCLVDDPSKKIAIKRINGNKELKANIDLQAGNTSTNEVKKFDHDREIENLRDLNMIKSPFLPEYYGAQKLQNTDGSYRLELGMELCDGNLEEYIVEKKNNLTFDERWNIFWQIAEGLKELHENNIAHRDLKPSNILYKKIRDDALLCDIIIWKIGDFGLATAKKEITGKCGTILFMAPEIKNNTTYDKSADIWSFGLILHFILLGYNYFEKKNTLKYELPPEDYNKLNEDIVRLLNEMIEENPQQRLTIQQILDYKNKENCKSQLFNQINKNHNKQYKYNTNKLKQNKLKNTILKKFPAIHSMAEAERAYQNAQKHMHIGCVDKVLKMSKDILQYYKKLGNIAGDSGKKIFKLIADCHDSKNKFEKKKKYEEKILEIEINECKDPLKKVELHKNFTLKHLGLICNESLTHNQQKALQILIDCLGEDSDETINLTESTGIIWYFIGNPQMALEHFEKVLRIKIKLKPKDSTELIALHKNIGEALISLNKNEEALFHYKRALSIKSKLGGEFVYNAEEIYRYFMNQYGKLLTIQDQLKYLKEILLITYTKSHYYIQSAKIYNYFADQLQRLKKKEYAFAFYEESLKLRITNFQDNEAEMENIFHNFEKTFGSEIKFDEALYLFQKYMLNKFSLYNQAIRNLSVNHKCICIDILLLIRARETQELKCIIGMIINLCFGLKFKLIIFMKNSSQNQYKDIKDIMNIFPVAGVLLITDNLNMLSMEKKYNQITNGFIYYCGTDTSHWHKIIGISKRFFYLVRDEYGFLVCAHQNKKKIKKNLNTAVKYICKNNFKKQNELLFQDKGNGKQDIFREFEEFHILGPLTNNSNSSFPILLLQDNLDQSKLYFGKQIQKNINGKNYESCEFTKYLTVFYVKMLSLYGVTVSDVYLLNQMASDEYSINEHQPYLITEFLKQIKKFPSTFLANYKTISKKNCYSPVPTVNKCLYGFGNLVAVLSLLQSLSHFHNCIDLDVGYVEKNHFFELVVYQSRSSFNIARENKSEINLHCRQGNKKIHLLDAIAKELQPNKLCKHHKLEFQLIVQKLENADKIEENVWLAMMKTRYKNEFVAIKENVIKSRNEILSNFLNKTKKIFYNLNCKNNFKPINSFNNAHVLVVDIQIAANIWKNENYYKIIKMMKLLQNKFNIKLFIRCQKIQDCEGTGINEFKDMIAIDGIISVECNEEIEKEFNPSNKRDIYSMASLKNILNESVNRKKLKFYELFGIDDCVIGKIGTEIKTGVDILSFLYEIYENEKELISQKKPKKSYDDLKLIIQEYNKQLLIQDKGIQILKMKLNSELNSSKLVFNLEKIIKKGVEFDFFVKYLNKISMKNGIYEIEIIVNFESLFKIDVCIRDILNIMKRWIEFEKNFIGVRKQTLNLSMTSYEHLDVPTINFIKSIKNLNELLINIECPDRVESDTNKMQILPTEITHLSCLKQFTCNQVSSSGIQPLSDIIKQFKNLTQLCLNLRSNQITAIEMKPLSSAISQLWQLSELNLNFSHNLIDDDGVKCLITKIAILKNLTQLILNFKYNKATDAAIHFLFITVAALKNLKHLELQFSNNKGCPSKTHWLSDGIMLLTKLTHLDSNSLKNQNNKEIAPSQYSCMVKFPHLTKLILNFESNNISAIDILLISADISQFTCLTQLILNFKWTQFSDSGIQSLSTGIKKLAQLTKLGLNFEWSKVSDNGLHFLTNCIADLKDLTLLNLNFESNKISNHGIKSLSTIIAQLKQLTRLSLNFSNNRYYQSNTISAVGVDSLSNAIARLSRLTKLKINLSCSLVGDDGIGFLSAGISKLMNLTTLILNFEFNHINSSGIESLLTKLSNLKQLMKLTLNFSNPFLIGRDAKVKLKLANIIRRHYIKPISLDNRITAIDMISLSAAIAQLPQLAQLNLNFSRNFIRDDGIKSLSTGVAKLKNLTHLILNFEYNQISDDGIESLSTSIAQLKDLKNLNLLFSENQATDNGIKFLSNGIAQLTHLAQLSLNFGWNKISDSGLQSLSHSIAKLILLMTLTLNFLGNNISENGKKTIEDLRNINPRLKLSSNTFINTI